MVWGWLCQLLLLAKRRCHFAFCSRLKDYVAVGRWGESSFLFAWAHINLANVFCNKRPIAISQQTQPSAVQFRFCVARRRSRSWIYLLCCVFLLNKILDNCTQRNTQYIHYSGPPSPPPFPAAVALGNRNWPIWRNKAARVFKANFPRTYSYLIL